MPTMTAAAPTKLCSIATSSGIEVIATRAARTPPITQPIASAPPSTPTSDQLGAGIDEKSSGTSSTSAVITTAITMPITPMRFPRCALSCVDSPRRLRMKRMLATRYASDRMVAIIVNSPSFPEHLQHALRDEKTARDVDRGDQDGDAAQRHRPRPAAVKRQHAADDDDAADRVGHAHERRVQRRRHVPDDVPADHTGQQEHGQVLDELGRSEDRR